MRDWTEHIILKTIARGNKLSERVMSDVSEANFISSTYSTIFKRLSTYYLKTGRVLRWNEIIQDAAIPKKVRDKVRGIEVKRKNLIKSDDSVRLPATYEQAKTFVGSLVTYSQQVGLIDLQNDLSEKLRVDKLTKEDVDGIMTFCVDEVEKISGLYKTEGNVVQLPKISVDETWNQFVNSLGTFHIPTGFNVFDSRNSGIPRDSYWLISATSGGGKSTMALQAGMNQYRAGARVCIVSLEMSFEQNLLRVIANLTRIPMDEITRSPDKYYERISKALTEFFIDKRQGVATFDFYTPEDSENLKQILTFLKRKGYDIIYIDYVTLLEPLHTDGWKALDMAGRYAKVFASRNQTVVSLLAQWDKEKDQVRYGRALTEHASNAWKWITDEDEIQSTGLLEIKQPKARNQVPFPFKLKMEAGIARITSYESEDLPETGDVSPVVYGFDDIEEEDKKKSSNQIKKLSMDDDI